MLKKDFKKDLENLSVPNYMIDRALIGLNSQFEPINQLFKQRTIPERDWNDEQIKQLLFILSNLDSDKDPKSIRIGEREGRISTRILNELSGGFCHGVGRGGELTAAQPKAAGASLMQNLTNKIVLSLIRNLGLVNIKSALCVPLATGMSIGLAIRGALNYYNIDFNKQNMVLMTQIDHKSPIKGIKFIGGDINIVNGHFGPNYHADEGVYCSIEDIEKHYSENSDKISIILSNCSFFAPRVPDDLKKIAIFAQNNNLIHIINNAYGVQSPEILKLIRRAIDSGRVDAIVQSTDKSFLTPVGGAVITSPYIKIIDSISKAYAGRASANSCLNLMVSLLSMGKERYLDEIKHQKINRILLEEKLTNIALKNNEKIIKSKNQISCAMSLTSLSSENISKLGGYLYNLRVTGPRVINIKESSFGSCTTREELPFSYIVMNAAIGVKKNDILSAIKMLEKAISQIKDQ